MKRNLFFRFTALTLCFLFVFSSNINVKAANYENILQTNSTISQTTTVGLVTASVVVNKGTSSVNASITTDRDSFPVIYVSLDGSTYYGGLIRNSNSASASHSVSGYNPPNGYGKYSFTY